jgi:hypothetical protein
MKRDRVDGIQNDGHVARTRARVDQPIANLARHRDDVGTSSEHPSIARVVQQPFPPAVAGPPMRRGEWGDPQAATHLPREQIRLVVVCVDDVDAFGAYECFQAGPDPGIERVSLPDLDIVDGQALGPFVHLEHRIALIPDVTDGDRVACGIRAGGAEQDRLFRPSPCSPYRPKFQDTDRALRQPRALRRFRAASGALRE